eukprot:CCRYP_011217-RA/>CCRYP_011217-RA protein AED:0.42 eAED:0.42 QI:0/-1/0/1/-1/1/1/0/79
MPPRFPHRLLKPPTQMSIPELVVFGVLGVSVTAGLLQMGSDALNLYRQKDNADFSPGTEPKNRTFLSDACPIKWGKREN